MPVALPAAGGRSLVTLASSRRARARLRHTPTLARQRSMASISWAYGSRGHEEEQTAAGQRRQFDCKAAALRALFAGCTTPAVLGDMQLVRSPTKHHRHRAQIAVVKGQRLLGMWDAATKEMVPIDHEAALFSASILLAVKELQDPAVPEVLWRRLTNVHAHSTAAGDICLTLCYARHGAPTRRGRAQGETRAAPEPPAEETEWRAAAQAFREQLVAAGAAAGTRGAAAAQPRWPSTTHDFTAAEQSVVSGAVRSCAVVGQWRKHAVVVGELHLEEEFRLRDPGSSEAFAAAGNTAGTGNRQRILRYRQVAGQFSNPNPAVAAAYGCLPTPFLSSE